MSRVDVTQVDVVEALLARLRSRLKLTDRQCWFTLEPLGVKLPPGGDYYITVAPGNGQFPPEEQVGGNITEDWSVDLTIYSRMRLDSTNSDEHLTLDAARGLFALKKKVLAVVVGHDLQDRDGNEFLRQLLHVTGCERPNYDDRQAVGWITLNLGVSFDWDLT